MTAPLYSTTWRVTPARIVEEHALHVAQLDAQAALDAMRAIARRAAERRGLAIKEDAR